MQYDFLAEFNQRFLVQPMTTVNLHLCPSCIEDARCTDKSVEVNSKPCLVIPCCSVCVRLNRSIGFSVYKALIEPQIVKLE